LQEVLTSLQPVSARTTIEYNQPLAVVRERLSQAAIAIVPSKWDEPFGRTALEAHAAGCAVISSGTGGLPEVSGDHAIFLPQGFGSSDVRTSVEILVEDEERRAYLGIEGRKYCMQKFALNGISESADLFYEEVVRQMRGSHHSSA
jgi:glycosyltransferase involved in cell wall biosynthesis